MSTLKDSLAVSYKIKHTLLYNPAITIVLGFSRETEPIEKKKKYIYIYIYIYMYICVRMYKFIIGTGTCDHGD